MKSDQLAYCPMCSKLSTKGGIVPVVIDGHIMILRVVDGAPTYKCTVCKYAWSLKKGGHNT